VEFFVQRYRIILVTIFLMLGLFPVAFAEDNHSVVGVVLLHGKLGTPAIVGDGVTDLLKASGFIVEVPEMAWSHDRYIDMTLDEAFNEIDRAVARLKAKGAQKIVIAGHSMGGEAALAYAANHGHVDGIILLAPGNIPDSPSFIKLFADDVAKARSMIAAGQGDQRAAFTDRNSSKTFVYNMKAKYYDSYFDSEGIGAGKKNCTNISPDIAVLYVVGSLDPLSQLGPEFMFNNLPANRLTQYVVVTSDHLGTPKAAVNEMISWLKDLGAQ